MAKQNLTIVSKQPTMSGKTKLHFQQKKGLGKNVVDPKPKEVTHAEAELFNVGDKYDPKKYSKLLSEKKKEKIKANKEVSDKAEAELKSQTEKDEKEVQKFLAKKAKDIEVEEEVVKDKK